MNIWDYLQQASIASYLVVGVFGLCIGSFFNVVVYRLPLMMHRVWHKEASDYLVEYPDSPKLPKYYNLIIPRSQCPNCQVQIKWWQNLPVLSFILLKGYCRCGKAISWRYPLTELITAIVSILVMLHYDWSPYVWPALIFSGYLIVLAFIDLQQQLLPDDLTLGLLWLGLLSNCFGFNVALSAAVLGAVVGYVGLWIIAKVFYFTAKREGMAYGDFKLLAALGAWLGWQCLPLVLLLACLSGIVVNVILHCFRQRHLRQPIPFGPYLALAGWLYLLYGDSWFPQLSMGGF